MPNFWKSLGVGTSYDQINQALGGLPDFFKGVQQRVNNLPINQPIEEKYPVFKAITAGLEGAGDVATGGLRSAVMGQFDPERAAQVKQYQQQNPVATGIGQGAGLALGMGATPTAAPEEGALTATRILPTIGRNALTAAGAAAPGTVAEGIQTGDWGQALTHGLENTAIGTAMGTTAEKGSQLLDPLLQKIQLVAQGGKTKDVLKSINELAAKRGLNKMGMQAATAEDRIKQAVSLGNEQGLVGGYFQAGKKAIWNKITDGYDKIASLVDNAGHSVPDAITQIVQRDDLAKAKRIFGDDAVNTELVNQAKQLKGAGWTDARIQTRDDMDAALRAKKAGIGNDNPLVLKGAVAEAIHNHLGETAQNLVDAAHQAGNVDVPNLYDLDAAYGAAKIVHGAGAREAVSLPATFAPGSDTAPRNALINRILSGGLVAGEGVGGAALLGGFDPNDPSSYLKTLGGIAAGTLGGRMLNRGVGKLAELTTGLGARGMSAGLEAAQPIAPQIAQVGARLPQVIGHNLPQPEQDQESAAPPGTEPIPNAPAAPVQATPVNLTQAFSLPQPEPAKVAPEHAEAVKQATDKEAQLTPDQVQNARAAVIAPFADKVKQALYQKWEAWQNPYKMDWEAFERDAEQKSNNFDPKNPYTAKFIAGADYQRYLKSYNVALNLQDVGKDLAEALSTGIHPLLGGLFSPEMTEKRNILVKTLYTAMTGDMKDPDATTRKSIEGTLYRLARGGGNKRAKLEQLLQDQYGVNFDQLRQYGLYK